MSISKGSLNVSDIKYGSEQISAVYKGDVLIWSNASDEWETIFEGSETISINDTSSKLLTTISRDELPTLKLRISGRASGSGMITNSCGMGHYDREGDGWIKDKEFFRVGQVYTDELFTNVICLPNTTGSFRYCYKVGDFNNLYYSYLTVLQTNGEVRLSYTRDASTISGGSFTLTITKIEKYVG